MFNFYSISIQNHFNSFFIQSSTDDSLTEVKQPYSLEAADANAIEEVNLAYENVKEVECLDISKEGCDAWDAAVKRYDERIGEFGDIFQKTGAFRRACSALSHRPILRRFFF